jgi:hypothetical protein
VLVPVSTNINNGAGKSPEVAGLDLLMIVTPIESVEAVANPVTPKVPAVVESDFAPVSPAVPLVAVNVNAEPAVPFHAACEGAELSKPIPNAATATSAMRLKFVFVDICFLSLVVTRNFLVAASR